MKTAKNKSCKVKGAVLMMILAVMTVLIILLAGTIAVVYSTHERVTKKYQESQAYYTMRSTLETCLNNTIQSKKDALTNQILYHFSEGSISVLTASDDLERGAVEELVLWQVPVSTETNSSDPDYNRWYDKNSSGAGAIITNASMVNITESDLNSSTYSGITNFSQYKAQYACPEWTSGMHKGVDDTVEFTIDINTIANMAVDESGNRLTKMLDTGATDTAVVKFQVLERKYSLGGSTSDPIGKQFMLGNRKEDYFKVKVTCEINIDGEKQSYSVIYSTKPPEPVTGGVSSLSKMDPGSKIRMFNDANSLLDTNYWFQNNSATTGDVSLFGDLEVTASACEFVLGAKDIYFVKDTIDFNNQPSPFIIAAKGGTIYCNNIVESQQPVLKLENSSEANIIVSGTYATQNQNSMNVNVFVDTFEWQFNNPPGNTLFTGSNKNYFNTVVLPVDPTNTQYVTISGNTITYGDNFRKLVGKSVVTRSIMFKWNNGTEQTQEYVLTGAGGAYSLVADDPSDANKNICAMGNSSTLVKVNYDDPAHAVYDPSTFMKQITLPGALVQGGNTLDIKTQRSIFAERFEEVGTDGTNTWTADGKFDRTFDGTTADKTFLWAHLKARELLPTVTKDASSPASYLTCDPPSGGVPGIAGGSLTFPNDPSDSSKGNTTMTFDSIITPSDGTVKLSGNYGGHTAIDVTSGDVTIVMDEIIKGNFYVVGSGKVKIYLTSSDGEFEVGSSGIKFSLVDFNTINASDGSINMISGQENGPKTMIYVPDDASGNPLVTSMKVQETRNDSKIGAGVICAQIDAPKTDMEFIDGGNGRRYTITYSGYTLTQNANIPFTIMGSSFTNSFKSSQERGIWSMVPPSPPGEKSINLDARYRG